MQPSWIHIPKAEWAAGRNSWTSSVANPSPFLGGTLRSFFQEKKCAQKLHVIGWAGCQLESTLQLCKWPFINFMAGRGVVPPSIRVPKNKQMPLQTIYYLVDARRVSFLSTWGLSSLQVVKDFFFLPVKKVLPNASLCAWCTVRPDNIEMLEFGAEKCLLQGHERRMGALGPQTPNSLKDFSKAFLKARKGRGMVGWGKLLGVGILCSWSCPYQSSLNVPVNLCWGKCYLFSVL